jgi:glucose/arabinose dehydrogenase
MKLRFVFGYQALLLVGLLLLIGVSCDDDDGDGGNTGKGPTIGLELIADGLASPTVVLESTDNTGRLFIVDQSGQIHILKNGTAVTAPFLDISGKVIQRQSAQDERGLLGLAFHPDFASNGRFFVYYSGPLRSGGTNGFDHTNYVAEYHADPGSDQSDGTERILLAIDHPQANHNAGMIAFGKDGYLYISVGDGGGANDTAVGHVDGGNGQDITQNLLGNILRIDVSPTTGYGIPSDNPFVDSDGLDEIYAYGFRNPYRFSFDPNGQIIVADAGQDLYEEIDLVELGGNYGWNIKEGTHCFDPENPGSAPSSCDSDDAYGNSLKDPVIEFKNSKNFSDGLGNVSIGGYVYEGSIAELSGKYIFGVLTQKSDVANGAVFAADRTGDTWSYSKLEIGTGTNKDLNEYVLGFGKDKNGEVYILTNGGTQASGKVYKITE